MSKLKTYSVFLVTRGVYGGAIKATSIDDAIARGFNLWDRDNPHLFDKDTEQLMTVTAEEEDNA
jgi:hypothetical protein